MKIEIQKSEVVETVERVSSEYVKWLADMGVIVPDHWHAKEIERLTEEWTTYLQHYGIKVIDTPQSAS